MDRVRNRIVPPLAGKAQQRARGRQPNGLGLRSVRQLLKRLQGARSGSEQTAS